MQLPLNIYCKRIQNNYKFEDTRDYSKVPKGSRDRAEHFAVVRILGKIDESGEADGAEEEEEREEAELTIRAT